MFSEFSEMKVSIISSTFRNPIIHYFDHYFDYDIHMDEICGNRPFDHHGDHDDIYHHDQFVNHKTNHHFDHNLDFNLDV